MQVDWSTTIIVPFAPETPASGIGETGFFRACWYRRRFDAPELEDGQRLLLHFGAVDYAATVWVNGRFAARHEGGYTPFQADITDLLDGDGPQTIVVRAEDDPHDLAKPRGKQDWQLEPHSIWYPRTTGIWQTVWLERVPATRIGTLRWASCLMRWEIALQAFLEGEPTGRPAAGGPARSGDRLLADDSYAVLAGEVHRRIALSDPGIDDSRNELLWSPASPTLIQARLRLRDGAGAIVDEVQSYTALRTIGIQGDRFVLNGRPCPLRLVLDQGYWPETGLTAPDDDALRRDVELAKAMGFNGVRKHQKIEDPRYLYWADVLGLLVWEEMPSAYRYTKRSIERLLREWTEAVDRDMSHPCIVAWVPFNESWGVPDLPDSPAQRHYVQALYHLTKTLDPTRPVVGNDGWESVATDIIGIHDYDDRPDRIAARYGSAEGDSACSTASAPAAGSWSSTAQGHVGLPIVLSEFGGIKLARRPGRDVGLLQRRDARRSSPGGTPSCSPPCGRRRCWPGSATRSSPTPTRRPTACSMPTGRPSSRWSRSRRPPAGRSANASGRTRRRWRERLMEIQRDRVPDPRRTITASARAARRAGLRTKLRLPHAAR